MEYPHVTMDSRTHNYWSERYKNLDIPWDAGKITPPIKEFIDNCTDRSIRILLPGGGNAYEAEYLFYRGFLSTYVLDISPLPLHNLARRCPQFPEEQLICTDFFSHTGAYDLILEQTFFCALPKEKRSDYVLKMYELLVPDGLLAGVLFDDRLNDDRPPYGGNREEYKLLFSTHFELVTLETCYNSLPGRRGREVFIKAKRI